MGILSCRQILWILILILCREYLGWRWTSPVHNCHTSSVDTMLHLYQVTSDTTKNWRSTQWTKWSRNLRNRASGSHGVAQILRLISKVYELRKRQHGNRWGDNMVSILRNILMSEDTPSRATGWGRNSLSQVRSRNAARGFGGFQAGLQFLSLFWQMVSSLSHSTSTERRAGLTILGEVFNEDKTTKIVIIENIVIFPLDATSRGPNLWFAHVKSSDISRHLWLTILQFKSERSL